MSTRRRALLCVLVGVLLLMACQRESAPPRADGTTTTLRDWVFDPDVAADERDANCARLLSAAPSITEICCALGLGRCLVGRTRYCTYPPAIHAVPSIGALNDLNAEALLEIKPDLILLSGTSRQIADRLTGLGLRFEAVPDWSLADLYTAIERIGVLTGRARTAARLADGLRTDLSAVAGRFASGPRVRVLIVTAPLADPPTRVDAAGPGSFYQDLLRLVGHTNIAEPGQRSFAPLGLEFVLRADPDVIVELAPDATRRPAGDADAWQAWAKVGPLRAVARHRVHVLVGPQYFLLGPRIAQTFEALCEAIAENGHE